MGFDKFAWMNAVFTDERIEGSQPKVLLWLAWHYAGDADLVYVRQQTIADRLGVSLRTVNEAFRTGKELGYLVLSESRRGGHRTSPNQWRLTPPMDADSARSEYTQEVTRLHATNDTTTRKKRHEYTQQPPPLTSENVDPKRSLEKVFKEGSYTRSGDRMTMTNNHQPTSKLRTYAEILAREKAREAHTAQKELDP